MRGAWGIGFWPHLMAPGSEDLMWGLWATVSLVCLCRWNPGPGRRGKWGLRTPGTQGLMLGASQLPRGHGDWQICPA